MRTCSSRDGTDETHLKVGILGSLRTKFIQDIALKRPEVVLSFVFLRFVPLD